MQRGTAMPFSRPLPRGLKKVLDLLESDPSQTLTVSQLAALGGVAPRTLQKHFRHFLGPATGRAAGITDEIATALLRLRWFPVTVPGKARYHLRGKVRDDGRGQLRVTVILVDASTGNYLWADQWDGQCRDAFGLEER